MNSYYSNELAGSVEDINLSEIVLPPSLLRSNLNGVEELAESIKNVGLLQPIIVRVNDAHSFEIVAGYRRFNFIGIADRLVGTLSDISSTIGF